jgi:hypothetical protein
MTHNEHEMHNILRDLQERAKELRCLYEVGEILRMGDVPWPARLSRILEVVPPGLQYPEVCEARLELEGFSAQTPGYAPSPWRLQEPVRVQEEEGGTLEVVYTRERPPAEEGPFLQEERKLIRTIAQQIGFQLTHEHLASAWESWNTALEGSELEDGGKWQVIVEFLDRTDPQLLQRIGRRMLHHLQWKGVAGLPESPGLARSAEEGAEPVDDNQPTARRPLEEQPVSTDEVFRIASEHCSEEEILACVHGWINRDKLSFLINTLEWQESSLGDIVNALSRFQALEMAERELPPTLLRVLRAALVRRFFTDQIDYVNAAKECASLQDFHHLASNLIHPPDSHGKLGGKSAGIFLAQKIVEQEQERHEALRGIRVPRTWHVASDGVIAFVRHNGLEDVYDRKYMELEQVRQQYPNVVQVFKSSPFPPELMSGLSVALDDLGDVPLIVRSSSLLEDSTGASFSGKYKSLFLANRGPRHIRLAALLDAVAEVYASIFGPDPIGYRAERNLLDVHEEMGIMIQEVVGARVGQWFLPAFSGVAFSNNEFRWSPRIRREDGLVRIVPGLGTRAVDRVADDFPVLLSPGQPGLRVNQTPDEILRYSPKMVDVIDLDGGTLETVPIAELLVRVGNDLPLARRILSIVEHERIRKPGALEDLAVQDAVVTFEGLVTDTPFLSQMATLLDVLRERLGMPVDIEFASDGQDLYLLQCRAQSYEEGASPMPIPRDIPRNKVLFTANRYISNGRIPDLTHVVWIDPEGYAQLPELADLKAVAKAVGRLNQLLPERQFALMGPGRWGSRGDIRLGVNVTYSEINNTSLLIEIAHQTGKYAPELSFGTHFFQDLVEARIRYLPLYPEQEGNVLDEIFFRRAENLLPDLVPEFAHLSEVVRVIDVPRQTEGNILRVLMNAELGEAVGYLAEPDATVAAEPASRFPRPRPSEPAAAEPHQDEHWQWRLWMAEKLASQLDPERFGVEGLWVFGSTKNATAGPRSDIDLLIHFTGTEEQKLGLLTWLQGWSLALAEFNYVRTGYRSSGLLDAHLISDEDIRNRTSYAVKIGAVTDPARQLSIGVRGGAG